MSRVAIEKVDGNQAGTDTILNEMESLSAQIRQRAFDLFERRGGSDGSATDDWLHAERDLVKVPESELIERDGKFEVQVSTPGIDPEDVKVAALPDALIVKANTSHHHDESEGNVRFCEFGESTLFRRFDLPEPIDPDNVKANLDKGVLHLTAPKARQDASSTQGSIAA